MALCTSPLVNSFAPWVQWGRDKDYPHSKTRKWNIEQLIKLSEDNRQWDRSPGCLLWYPPSWHAPWNRPRLDWNCRVLGWPATWFEFLNDYVNRDWNINLSFFWMQEDGDTSESQDLGSVSGSAKHRWCDHGDLSHFSLLSGSCFTRL